MFNNLLTCAFIALWCDSVKSSVTNWIVQSTEKMQKVLPTLSLHPTEHPSEHPVQVASSASEITLLLTHWPNGTIIFIYSSEIYGNRLNIEIKVCFLAFLGKADFSVSCFFFPSFLPSQFTVRVGEWDLSDDDNYSVELPVTSIVAHPNFRFPSQFSS